MIAVIKTLLLFFSALFPVVDPLGASPIFLALTKQYTKGQRRDLSRRIAMNSFFLLVGSYLIGAHVIAFFGISLPAVQIGGGLIVISTGWTILKRREDNRRSEVDTNVPTQDAFRDAFYPLTLPLTVGPGSISVAVTLGANAVHGFNYLAILAALIGSAAIALSIFLCYGFADRLAQILGPTAMSVIVRLSSFLLFCIGVQIVWNGVSALLASRSVGAH